MTSEEIIALKHEMLEELKELEEEAVGYPYIFSAPEAYFLLFAVQLVLRHPGMKEHAGGLAAQWLKAFGEELQQRLCTRPALAQIAQMGWDWEPPHEETGSPVIQ